jgi:hypothetical protein
MRGWNGRLKSNPKKTLIDKTLPSLSAIAISRVVRRLSLLFRLTD